MKRLLQPQYALEIESQTNEHENQHMFDIHALKISQQKLKKAYQHCLSLKQAKHFENFEFKQQTFRIGDTVHLYDITQNNPYVAKITKIIMLPQIYNCLPFIEVEWYLNKGDFFFSAKNSKYYDHISTGEVFPSGQLMYVLIESIKHKCLVGKRQIFEKYGGKNMLIHFTRASYNFTNQQFTPYPSEWESNCICNMPINPQLPYVQCQLCQLWFHTACVLDKKALTDDQPFICGQCISRKTKRSSIIPKIMSQTVQNENQSRDAKSTAKVYYSQAKERSKSVKAKSRSKNSIKQQNKETKKKKTEKQKAKRQR